MKNAKFFPRIIAIFLLLSTDYLLLWSLLYHAQGKGQENIAIMNWGHIDLPMTAILTFMHILNTTILSSQKVNNIMAFFIQLKKNYFQ
jgi:hypothetical protein